jgi:hypothetical protein
MTCPNGRCSRFAQHVTFGGTCDCGTTRVVVHLEMSDAQLASLVVDFSRSTPELPTLTFATALAQLTSSPRLRDEWLARYGQLIATLGVSG